MSMGEKTALLLLFIASLQIAASSHIRKDDDASTTPTPYSKSQKIEVTIVNNVDSLLKVKSTALHWGSWVKSPSSIGSYSEGYYSNKGSTFAGPENDVYYMFSEYENYGTLQIYTNIDHFGGTFSNKLYYSQAFKNFFDISERKVSKYHLEISLQKKD